MTIDFLDSRYVFFFSCIDSVGDEMSQFLAGIDEFFRYLRAYRYSNAAIFIVTVKFYVFHMGSSFGAWPLNNYFSLCAHYRLNRYACQ